MITDDWKGCYRKGWNGTLVPEAFAHPAKVSFGLAEKIYQHLFEQGWLAAGDTVIDPFGGIAGCGFHAALKGCQWIGCELEERFVRLGNANIQKWRTEYGMLPGYGSITLVQGDSRELVRVVTTAQAAVSSPPYADTELTYKKNGILEDGQQKYERPCMKGTEQNYGSTPGQLGAMKAGDFDAAISSPPYADGCAHTGGDTPTSSEHIQGGSLHGVGIDGVVSSPPYSEARIGQESGQEHCGRGDQYGPSTGQLGAMKADGFEAAVSSPPFGTGETRDRAPLQDGWVTDCMKRSYTQDNQGETPGNLAHMSMSSPPFEAVEGAHSAKKYADPEKVAEDIARKYQDGTFKGHAASKEAILRSLQSANEQEYGSTPGNIGNDSGDNFWQAARTIVEQTYLALRPGGHACWIVKSFVKDKQIVPFPDQWRQLCEAVGFVTLHEHHAWLVEEKGTQFTLDGEAITKRTERKSFFRRLAEKKGSPRIDYEIVFCMEKPA